MNLPGLHSRSAEQGPSGLCEQNCVFEDVCFSVHLDTIFLSCFFTLHIKQITTADHFYNQRSKLIPKVFKKETNYCGKVLLLYNILVQVPWIWPLLFVNGSPSYSARQELAIMLSLRLLYTKEIDFGDHNISEGSVLQRMDCSLNIPWPFDRGKSKTPRKKIPCLPNLTKNVK